MKHVISGLVLFLFIVPATFAFSSSHMIENIYESERMAIGTIQALARNTIQIYDETDRTVKNLVYLDYAHPFQVGDRVRVYYILNGYRVILIKKMSSLEYSKDKQNLGYIMQRPQEVLRP